MQLLHSPKKRNFWKRFLWKHNDFFCNNILFKSTYFVQLYNTNTIQIQIFSRYNIEKHANNRHSRERYVFEDALSMI